jgi:hypothetical protein
MSTVDELTRAYGPPPEPERERPRMSRRKRVALLVAFLLGLPALALAATYFWGTFTGETVVNNATAAVTLSEVTGTGVAVGGVECTGTGKDSNDMTNTKAKLVAVAYRVTVNGIAPPQETDLGYCNVAVKVHNAGTAPASIVAKLNGPMPLGWTFGAPTAPTPIGGNGDATILVKLSADGRATAGLFSGDFTIDIPPAGAGGT